MTALQIRIAKRADADNIIIVINSAFRRAEEFFIDGDRVDLAEVLKLFGTGKFLLAESERQLRGCVYIEPARANQHRPPDRAYLGLLAVDPASQESGVGSALMNAAENYCRERGANFMDIKMVSLRAELFGFYHRRGYVETGTSAFPADVETKLDCHFIELSKPLSVPAEMDS